MRWSFADARVLALVAASWLAMAGVASAQTCHSGEVEGDHIVWRTVVWGDARFLAALPDEVSVESIDGGSYLREGERVVGVARASPRGRVVLVTRQRLGDRSEVTLRPPLTPGLQRVVLTARGAESVTFAPALDGAVERHVGYHATHDLGWSTRRTLDDVCGARAGHAIPIYVSPTSASELRGTLVRASERRTWLMVLGGVLLAAAVIAGVVVYRRFARRAEIERADAVIEARFRELHER